MTRRPGCSGSGWTWRLLQDHDSRGQPIKTTRPRGVSSIDEIAGQRHDSGMTGSSDSVHYAYKASLAGVGWRYELRHNALHWQADARQGSVYYRGIARVWMSYRPTSM